MAELTPQERLQPALLDRLTDDDPGRKVESREQRVLSKARLREAVLRDLAWLFNSTRMSGDVDWQNLPHANRSVINFGLPALSGETASTLDIVNLEADVKRAIMDFEPRIMASTLKVEALVSELQMDHHNVVSLRISGHLWAQPIPFELLLRTEVDLETGQVEIQELAR
ncbi:type VI secretion system baseplate subunit TssE [Eleftheria terrae]|uniref:type VI secretion system baseplate subunit TssE n=1 Tax=Eleftheria terrae TaxID=1597781 RepID=UPI00263B0477|nr:type VI secretion system baseplate subunit TssE [Eleftheria terrae]WKB53787.1 type VI secretion system baseplate subunit TssE [Eleftheria terrae]